MPAQYQVGFVVGVVAEFAFIAVGVRDGVRVAIWVEGDLKVAPGVVELAVEDLAGGIQAVDDVAEGVVEVARLAGGSETVGAPEVSCQGAGVIELREQKGAVIQVIRRVAVGFLPGAQPIAAITAGHGTLVVIDEVAVAVEGQRDAGVGVRLTAGIVGVAGGGELVVVVVGVIVGRSAVVVQAVAGGVIRVGAAVAVVRGAAGGEGFGLQEAVAVIGEAVGAGPVARAAVQVANVAGVTDQAVGAVIADGGELGERRDGPIVQVGVP